MMTLLVMLMETLVLELMIIIQSFVADMILKNLFLPLLAAAVGEVKYLNMNRLKTYLLLLLSYMAIIQEL